MTFATVLLALLTAASAPSSDAAAAPVLLDFHAEWCGPCRQVRPAIAELVHKGYPIKSIDIDQDAGIATRYGVDRVPTFIVVGDDGRELDRTSGPQSAADLARFYMAAKAKAQPPRSSHDREGPGANPDEDDDPPTPQSRRDDADDRASLEGPRADALANPHPAKTVVRIKIIGPHSTGFGSGTIVHSTPQESLILTCAHVFKLEGSRQAPPKRFPRKIVIDLFDGQLKGTNPAQVGFLESVDGEAVDYDFVHDVGLIRIRPGRRLPASRVVPAHWEPKSKPLPMKMLTLGCSGGQDATAWYTKILNPRMQGLSGNPDYEAIECWNAPKEGRSGGGLFTTDYYVAGVCNFAEPRGNHGLYATPRSIYRLLDRNHLMALYAPVARGSDTLVADGRSPSPSIAPSRPGRALTPIARLQSPDSDEAGARQAGANPEDIMLPHPSRLGIAVPVAAASDRSPQTTASTTTKRIAWHPIPTAPTAGAPRAPEPTALKVVPAAEPDQAAPTTTSPTKPRWHVVKTAPADLPAEISKK